MRHQVESRKATETAIRQNTGDLLHPVLRGIEHEYWLVWQYSGDQALQIWDSGIDEYGC